MTKYMDTMLSDNPNVRKRLYEQFNARICLVDIYNIYKQLETRSYDNCDMEILLPIEDNGCGIEALDFLKKNHYDQLIFDLINNVRISDDLANSLTAMFSQKNIDLFKKALIHPFDNEHSVRFDERGLVIHSKNFIVDTIIYPLSQFHTEVVKAMDCFIPARKMSDRFGSNIYLNAYSPSMFTQYAQFWVAERLDLLHFPSKIGVI